MTDIRFTRSCFGGGWLVPVSEKGTEFLAGYYGEPAYPLVIEPGLAGYIMEPNEAEGVAESAANSGVSILFENGGLTHDPA